MTAKKVKYLKKKCIMMVELTLAFTSISPTQLLNMTFKNNSCVVFLKISLRICSKVELIAQSKLKGKGKQINNKIKINMR